MAAIEKRIKIFGNRLGNNKNESEMSSCGLFFKFNFKISQLQRITAYQNVGTTTTTERKTESFR